jgi:hypothetical protein
MVRVLARQKGAFWYKKVDTKLQQPSVRALRKNKRKSGKFQKQPRICKFSANTTYNTGMPKVEMGISLYANQSLLIIKLVSYDR